MKLNKAKLTLAWGMSNKNAAIFARNTEMTPELLNMFCSKYGDYGTQAAAPIFAKIGFAEFVKLTNKKAKEETERRAENESILPAYCPILGNTAGLANWK